MKNVKSCQGFTLVEMLVTIIIFSILFIALLPMTQSIIKTTLIKTPASTSREEATFLTNSKFIDALYPMKFAVCTYTSDDRTLDNITSEIIIYTATSFSSNINIIDQLALESTTIRNYSTYVDIDGQRVYPSILGVNISNIKLFYGDKEFLTKPYANLSISYEGTVGINNIITGTVGMTKLTSPFALPIACFDPNTYTATQGRVIFIYFTQPITMNPTGSYDYLNIKCENATTTITDSTQINNNPSILRVTLNIDAPIAPPSCSIIFENSNIIQSYDGYTMSDLFNVLDNKKPYIEVTSPCP